eukprot:1880208-Amphidinium_carterae.1
MRLCSGSRGDCGVSVDNNYFAAGYGVAPRSSRYGAGLKGKLTDAFCPQLRRSSSVIGTENIAHCAECQDSVLDNASKTTMELRNPRPPRAPPNPKKIKLFKK